MYVVCKCVCRCVSRCRLSVSCFQGVMVLYVMCKYVCWCVSKCRLNVGCFSSCYGVVCRYEAITYVL